MLRVPYLVCFRGAGPLPWWSFGGQLTSFGIDRIARKARQLGYEVDVWNYGDFVAAYERLWWAQREGCPVAGLGYSNGCTTLCWLSGGDASWGHTPIHFELLMCVAMSEYGYEHEVGEGVKRSVVWKGSGAMSRAGKGFTETHVVRGVPHLLMQFDRRVVTGVLRELTKLRRLA